MAKHYEVRVYVAFNEETLDDDATDGIEEAFNSLIDDGAILDSITANCTAVVEEISFEVENKNK